MPYIGTSPSNGVRRVHTYTATASQTTFTGASSEGVTLSYVDTNYIDVFQNGVLLGSADYTSTSGTSVVLAQGASADDLIVIVVYDVFSVADTVSKTNGGSFDSAVTMSDNLTVSGAFTSQGIDDNANNTAIAIDSNEDFTITKQGFNTTSLTFANTSNSTVGAIKYDHASGRMLLNVHDAERMRFGSDGKVSIGTTTLDATTHIQTSGESHCLKVTHTENADKNLCTFKHEYAQGSQTATMIQFLNSVGNERGSIKTSGSATAFNTSSDYRLKENLNYDFDATTRLKQLKPCRFNWIADETNTLVDGFLAHEVSSIVPEAITGEKDATETYTDDDGNEQTIIKPQGIDQSKIVPLLVKTIQELEARITALENAE